MGDIAHERARDPITQIGCPSPAIKALLVVRQREILTRLGAHDKDLVPGSEHNEQVSEAFLEGLAFYIEAQHRSELQDQRPAPQPVHVSEPAFKWYEDEPAAEPSIPTFTSTGQHAAQPPLPRSALDGYLDLQERAFIEEHGSDTWQLEGYRQGVSAGQAIGTIAAIDLEENLRTLLKQIAGRAKAEDVANARSAFLQGVRIGRRAGVMHKAVIEGLVKATQPPPPIINAT